VSDPAALIRDALQTWCSAKPHTYPAETCEVCAKVDTALVALDELEAFYRWKDAIVETLRYVSVNVGSGDHVDAIQAEVDGLLGRLGVK
jgi:hypothetical protein